MVLERLVAHTAGRKATCKNNKVFTTPICIALVVQDVYLYYKLYKRKVKQKLDFMFYFLMFQNDTN